MNPRLSEEKFKDYKDLGLISLETFYPSGKSIATPIDYHKVDAKLYASTAQTTHKIKRLRKNPKATVALCNYRGKLKSDKVEVTVHIMGDDEEEKGKEMIQAIQKKFINRIFYLFNRAPRFYLEIS